MKKLSISEGKIIKRHPAEPASKNHAPPHLQNPGLNHVLALQQQVGNRTVQRLVGQRNSQEASELDDETTQQIEHERGGGQALDDGARRKMETAMGQDFSEVRVHTSEQSDTLNRSLGAKAFTTGKDIFFREGAYQPGSSAGQQLLAHELTHVVQQGNNMLHNSGKMKVNAPGDAFEQHADAVANQVVAASPTHAVQAAGVQRQELGEEDELAQRQPEEEENLAQAKEDEEETKKRAAIVNEIVGQKEEKEKKPEEDSSGKDKDKEKEKETAKPDAAEQADSPDKKPPEEQLSNTPEAEETPEQKKKKAEEEKEQG